MKTTNTQNPETKAVLDALDQMMEAYDKMAKAAKKNGDARRFEAATKRKWQMLHRWRNLVHHGEV